mmetsp:Transcript_3495/g.8899  ORF Transcript_3495/g.8899 Transcript_3495/m.8899 type:complete len:607 (-) Transcript_3495:421-2241(-)
MLALRSSISSRVPSLLRSCVSKFRRNRLQNIVTFTEQYYCDGNMLMSPLIVVASLLATGGGGQGGRITSRSLGSNSGRGGGGGNVYNRRRKGGDGNDGARRTGTASGGGRGRGRGGDVGRNRYTRDGIKKRTSASKNNNDGGGEDGDFNRKQEKLWPLPPLTVPDGPRPTYYTCRHTYEDTLMDEIRRCAERRGSPDRDNNADAMITTSSPYPGLVRVEDYDGVLPDSYDPVYALQCMPDSVVVTAESIKGIAREVLTSLLGDNEFNINGDEKPTDAKSEMQKRKLRAAERGSLSIHPLVPGMCKGQTNPIMLRRCTKIGEELSRMLKKMYPAARKAGASSSDEDGNPIAKSNERWVLQMMLQSPNLAAASLTLCRHVGPGENSHWPNVVHPLGIARVDVEDRMPSSAYRKLMEGVECMGIRPGDHASLNAATVVDLGACPGGWTSVARRCFGSRVVAVDRSEVDRALMQDEMVEFVKGDAFAFDPEEGSEGPSSCDRWMMSDVIAYPERTSELMGRWCANRWASVMIVTMKFQGNEGPDWDELERAIEIVKDNGYDCRVKHFFNNKNEVTFMVWSLLSESDDAERIKGHVSLEPGAVGTPMFPRL